MRFINEIRVREIYEACLFADEDVGSWIAAQGVVLATKFEPCRLYQYKSEVGRMLKDLPDIFEHCHIDHGATFAKMMEIRGEANERWTADVLVADMLLCLALALGLARYLLLREYWQYNSAGAMITFFLD